MDLFTQTLPVILLTILITALVMLVLLRFSGARRRDDDAHSQAREESLQRQIGELTARMQTMTEIFTSRQAEVTKSLTERLDGLSHKMGQNLTESGRQTGEQLRHLHERLAIIDKAQTNITDLSGQVTALQQILSDKQARGAFGQGRMEAIIRNALPEHGYQFQPTLSNNSRPDCLIHMPNNAPSLVVDAKFPLEAYNRIREAVDPENLRSAQTQFRTDMLKHIKDIGEKYFIPGETHDTAFMFVPSESVFAEIHENFDDVLQKAYRARIIIVSPSLLMLSIQVLQSILRDQRVREQAHIIQAEVGKLMLDMNRLQDRVGKLHNHFRLANKDVDDILTSTGKITSRGEKIAEVELDDTPLIETK